MKNLDILCCGELTLDEISIAEKLTDNESSAILKSTGHYFGGRGGNFSVYSSLFDVNVGIAAAIGNDPEGQEYKNYLASRKIDVSNLFENAKTHTSKCFIFREGKKNRIFFYGSALQEQREAYLEYIKKAVKKINTKAIYCTSPDQEINKIALADSGARTKIYGPSSNMYAHSKESFADCFGNTDILFLNQNESDFLERLLQKGVKEIISEFGIKLFIKTLGEKGSQIITEMETINVPACKPKKVLDTSGAGDAFAGSFTANYLKTKDILYSGKIASAVASLVVEEIGSQTNMPTIEKIMQRAKDSG